MILELLQECKGYGAHSLARSGSSMSFAKNSNWFYPSHVYRAYSDAMRETNTCRGDAQWLCATEMEAFIRTGEYQRCPENGLDGRRILMYSHHLRQRSCSG